MPANGCKDGDWWHMSRLLAHHGMIWLIGCLMARMGSTECKSQATHCKHTRTALVALFDKVTANALNHLLYIQAWNMNFASQHFLQARMTWRRAQQVSMFKGKSLYLLE